MKMHKIIFIRMEIASRIYQAKLKKEKRKNVHSVVIIILSVQSIAFVECHSRVWFGFRFCKIWQRTAIDTCPLAGEGRHGYLQN